MIDFNNASLIKLAPADADAAGTFDLDLWFSGLGKVRLEFTSAVDIRWMSQFIAGRVL